MSAEFTVDPSDQATWDKDDWLPEASKGTQFDPGDPDSYAPGAEDLLQEYLLGSPGMGQQRGGFLGSAALKSH